MKIGKILLGSAMLFTTLITSNSALAANVDSDQVDLNNHIYQKNNEIGTFGAGQWDQIGQHTFTGITGPKTLKTPIFKSYGGDFQLVFHYQEQNIQVQLWESDGAGGTDVLVSDWKTTYGYGGSVTYRNIGGYVDGTDGTAEFYAIIKLTDPTPKQRGLQVTAWD